MKKLILCAMLSALSLPTLAQTQEPIDTVTIRQPELRIELPVTPYDMSAREFYKFKGSYDLANGQTLSLFERRNTRYAQVSNQEKRQIVAADKNTFVAMDRQLKVRLDIDDNGGATGELWMVVPANNQVSLTAINDRIMMFSFNKPQPRFGYDERGYSF